MRKIFLVILILVLPARVPAGMADGSTLIAAIRELALQGDGEAQYSLALRYDMGEGVPRNPALALRWYARACAREVAGACFSMGMKYEFGNGVRKNVRQAMALYEQAALQGWPMAQFFLGRLYLAGDGIRHDPVRAAAWLTLAAEQEYPNAAALLQQSMTRLSPGEQARVTAELARLRKKMPPAGKQ
ncbi:MAG TPA: sel1 repeat family protein [Desulfobulbus sp.]|nr:sel1 repeat family protein [Desulfobulbus sp.]